MNPLALTIADGRAFFFGLAMVLAAEAAILWLGTGVLRTIAACLALVGVVLVLFSPVPVSLWALGPWLVISIGGVLVGNRGRAWRPAQIGAAALLLAATLWLGLAEAPYHFRPLVTVPPEKTVYVVGDSLSSGTRYPRLQPHERCWPEALHEMTGLPVVNLAVPGAKVHSAMPQLRGIQQPNSVVIVEIGGNDLLQGTDPGVFRIQLDALLAALRKDRHEILMFELPLYPFTTAFGRAQRELAAKYGVALIPSRCLTEVFGMKGGTIDGLHFSPAGHAALAAIVARLLRKQDGP
jgi:lysophospholipase L1-like esterase